MNEPRPNFEAENFELCHACGGLCCALYLAHDENGEYAGEEWLAAYIEEWFGKFVASGALVVVSETSGPGGGPLYGSGEHGVEPLHDPRLSTPPTPEAEAYRAGLPDSVDARKCQFCDAETGCLLPPEFRAPICHAYHCELWPDDELAPLEGR